MVIVIVIISISMIGFFSPSRQSEPGIPISRHTHTYTHSSIPARRENRDVSHSLSCANACRAVIFSVQGHFLLTTRRRPYTPFPSKPEATNPLTPEPEWLLNHAGALSSRASETPQFLTLTGTLSSQKCLDRSLHHARTALMFFVALSMIWEYD